MEKLFLKGLELNDPKVVEPCKMPRTAVIPVIRDKKYGDLNAGTYSGGVVSYNGKLYILFGPKTKSSIQTFKEVDEFCTAIPSKEQIDNVWVTALYVPKGINEIELADWETLPSKIIDTPGIKECPINLECKKVFCGQLPPPWRAIVVGEVVGVSINKELLEMDRSEVVHQLPIHEAGGNPETLLYGPSYLSGELIPSDPKNNNQQAEKVEYQADENGKIFVNSEELYQPENKRILSNSIFPMPSYVLMTTDENGQANALPVCGGALQSTVPTIQVPVPKDSYSYRNLKRTGECVVSIPDRSLIKNFELLEQKAPTGFAESGFTLLEPNEVNVSGLKECPVNIDCKIVMFEDIPGTDYALLVGRKVGVAIDKPIAERLDNNIPDADVLAYINRFYANFMYAVLDYDLNRNWGFHDEDTLSVRPLPSWGSRYTGGWWSGGGSPLTYWLIELVEEGLITKWEFLKVKDAVSLWNDGHGPANFSEYFTEELRTELKTKLTKLFKMMAWAHRDNHKWDKVHDFLATFPEPTLYHHSGPLYHDKWYGSKI